MPNQPVVHLVTGEELLTIQGVITQQLGTDWRHMTWVTKDKRRIEICKMDNQHIVNSLFYFRKKKNQSRTVALLTLEAAFRGLEEIELFDLLRLKDFIRNAPSFMSKRDSLYDRDEEDCLIGTDPY